MKCSNSFTYFHLRRITSTVPYIKKKTYQIKEQRALQGKKSRVFPIGGRAFFRVAATTFCKTVETHVNEKKCWKKIIGDVV